MFDSEEAAPRDLDVVVSANVIIGTVWVMSSVFLSSLGV